MLLTFVKYEIYNGKKFVLFLFVCTYIKTENSSFVRYFDENITLLINVTNTCFLDYFMLVVTILLDSKLIFQS